MLTTNLIEAFPESEVTINPTKPRSKSFEVFLIKDDTGKQFNEYIML
jgi:hypothetical protein